MRLSFYHAGRSRDNRKDFVLEGLRRRVVASGNMKPPSVRGLGLLFLGALAAAGQAGVAPSPAHSETQAIAIRGPVSSVSAGYGPAISLESLAPGHYLIPTSTGFEVRLASHAANDSLVAAFRSVGTFTAAALSGSTAWLAAGEQGLLAVDLAALDAPVSAGAYGGLGTVRCVGYAPAGQALAAATDSVLYLFRETAAGTLARLESRPYRDGRRLRRIAASHDSFLVAAERPGPIPRLYLTLYRVRANAAPESLWDFQANGHLALDLAWSGATAFVADGNTGVLPFRLATRQLRQAVPLGGGRYVSALDADDARVVVVGQGRTLATFDRAGAGSDSLVNETDHLLALEPADVSIVAGHALVSSASELSFDEPDEIGRSAIEDHDLGTGGTLPPVGGTGRVRRVAYDRGYAFVADYTGGLRVYRASGADTALVGVLPPAPGSRVYDIALDRTRKLACLAAGTAGVQVVDVSDPSAPVLLGSATPPGRTLCVAVVDTELVAAGWNTGPGTGGLTLIGVTDPGAPVLRGSASVGAGASIATPLAIAVRDTLAFVADPLWGVVSVGIGNPDKPGIVGVASGVVGTRDIDVTGNTLLAATALRGVQVVDVSQPNRLVLLAEVPLRDAIGVAQQGTSAIAFLGAGGAVALDLTRPSQPDIRGAIGVPGFSRDGAWVGDTLLVAASYGLERASLSPSLPASPSLALHFDPDASTGRVGIAWPPVPGNWIVGLDVVRETVISTGGSGGIRQVNGALLPPTSTSTTDPSVSPGTTYRYRLQALLPDGSVQEVAAGEIFISSTTRVGRPFPNPWRPSSSPALAIPFTYQATEAGSDPTAKARIYNVQGRLVRTLGASVSSQGGFGSFAWDGRDDRGVPVSSGFYYVSVRAPGVEGSCRALLLR